MSIPPLSSISSLIFNEESCINFLYESEILEKCDACPICGGRVGRIRAMFQCTRYSCKKGFSIFRNSFFASQRLKCNEILHLAYLWLTNCSLKTIQIHTGHSTTTISTYLGYFRQLISETIDTDDTMIGGQGIIVQVDETKMGKRKYNRGHRVEGAWVVVGVEITNERKLFAEVVQDRSEQTISDVLSRHICAGSTIWTDMWRGYSSLTRRFEVTHKTVNHSMWFKDPESGVHTNHVEGTNYALKHAIPKRNRTEKLLPLHLMEFVWRRKNERNIWAAFISALKEIGYPSN